MDKNKNSKKFTIIIVLFLIMLGSSLNNLFNQVGGNIIKPNSGKGKIDYDLFAKTWVYIPNSSMRKLDPIVYSTQTKYLPSSKMPPGKTTQNLGPITCPTYLNSPVKKDYSAQTTPNTSQQFAPSAKAFK